MVDGMKPQGVRGDAAKGKSSGQRLAALDIGTNSIRSIVVEILGGGDYRVLDDEKATVRLGEGLAASGSISTAAWERAAQALKRMKQIADGLGATHFVAVATSAVRKAANGKAFVAAMAKDAGVEIEVIDGEQEAELAALSARHHFDMAGSRYAMIDIGGGSVEMVTATGEHIEEIHSLELGAVLLTERFIHGDPAPEKDLARLRKHIRQSLKETLATPDFPVQCLIGSGGTLNAVGAMAMALRKEAYGSVHGYEVLRSEVVHLLAMLERKDARQRREIAGLSPERADIIIAGVTLVDELMRFFGANLLRINERGIREGLILKSLDDLGLMEKREARRDWRTVVQEFARSCHSDEGHAETVRDLSLQIFDGTAALHGLDERARQLLEAAALLHDVGYFIDYAKHHKHSYHLIRHAGLFGFTPREQEVVANLARYHRKSLPKKKHENFALLSAEDQQLVRQLGGILRLADGLDRCRSGNLQRITAELTGKTCTLRLEGKGDLGVELYGGQSKGDLFEEAFERKLVLALVKN